MPDTFLAQIGLSFIIGGLYIAAMIRLSEKFGSKLGGLLIGMPSVALVGLAFIGWIQGPSAILEATSVMPATLAASSIFLVAFTLLSKYGLVVAYCEAIAIWFALNLPITVIKPSNIIWALAISFVLFSVSIPFFHSRPHSSLPAFKPGKRVLLFRVVLAGSFIALAVACSKLLGPVWGGLFASFPAAFSATVIIFAKTHGASFTSSVSRSMVMGNLTNVVFVVSLHLLVSSLNIALGIIVAYIICLGCATLAYKYIMPKL